MRLFEKNITEQENGWTAEQVLRRCLGLSTTRIKRAKFRPDGILLDGVRINTAQQVRLGQHLELHLPELEENCLESAPGAVDIIYEDEWLLVVNKPAGLPVHPGPGHYADTLGNRLAGFYRQRGEELVFRPVNRLDKGTSGLMLCAKRAESHEALQNLLHTDEFQRDYLALLSRAPRPPRGTVDTPIAPVPGALNCYRTDPEGKNAKTDYVTLQSRSDGALVQLRLHTGRTHQIRVQFSSRALPLAGDVKYGSRYRDCALALWSHALGFRHPATGEAMSFSAMPEAVFPWNGFEYFK